MHEPIKCCWLILFFGYISIVRCHYMTLTRCFPVSFSSLCWMFIHDPVPLPRSSHVYFLVCLLLCSAPSHWTSFFRLKSFPSISVSIIFAVFFERKHHHLLSCMFISWHYVVPHTIGSTISIVSRLCMDTLLFSLSRSLCLLQRFHSLTHSSNDCSRVSRWLFSDKEVCAVYMDETKPIYMSMALVFCCSTLSSIRKIPIYQTRVHGEIVSSSTHFIECAYSFPRWLRDSVSR